MLALYRSGRQAEALAVYRAARRAMVEELGLEPGRDLHQLESAVLTQDPSLDLRARRRRRHRRPCAGAEPLWASRSAELS